ncbi:hypothetical protein [Azospirillum sp. sgz302134]
MRDVAISFLVIAAMAAGAHCAATAWCDRNVPLEGSGPMAAMAATPTPLANAPGSALSLAVLSAR